jgi:chromosome segregation ATPase
MEWITAIPGEWIAVAIAIAWVVIDTLKNRTQDRTTELAMMQSFIERASTDQASSDRYNEKYVEVLKKLHSVEMQLNEGKHEADRLVEKVAQQKELRMTEADAYKSQMDKLKSQNAEWSVRVEQLTKENEKLRDELHTLAEKHDALQRRVDEVEARADRNEEALQQEIERRKTAERERDTIRDERDKLAKQVATLEETVNALQAQIQALKNADAIANTPTKEQST